MVFGIPVAITCARSLVLLLKLPFVTFYLDAILEIPSKQFTWYKPHVRTYHYPFLELHFMDKFNCIKHANSRHNPGLLAVSLQAIILQNENYATRETHKPLQ